MKRIYFLFSLMTATLAHSQRISPSIINSTGGTASVGKYFVDWSLCEVTLTSTFSTPNLIVTQGVLQNNPDGNPTDIHNPVSFKKNVKVFPNPSKDILYMQSEEKSESKFQYALLDINGKIIFNNTTGVSLSETIQAIDLSGLPSGIYILQIRESKKEQSLTQSYKVQKIN